jgi:hypothetical protein
MSTISRVLRSTALAACFLACSDQGPEISGLRAEIEANRSRWVAQRPPSYHYEIERLCFCTEESRGPVRVVVVDGQVTARTYAPGGGAVPSDLVWLFPPADGLFDILLDALDREAHEIRVTWDDDTGLPVDFWIDYIENAIDEEVGYRILTGPTA